MCIRDRSNTHHEYVVPRSIPITVPTSFLSASFFLSSAPTTSKLLAKAKAQIVQIAFILKISSKPFLQTFSSFPFRGNYKIFLTSRAPDGWYFARLHAWRSLIGRSSAPVGCLWLVHAYFHAYSFITSIGRTRMSCHTHSSPAFSCNSLPVVIWPLKKNFYLVGKHLLMFLKKCIYVIKSFRFNFSNSQRVLYYNADTLFRLRAFTDSGSYIRVSAQPSDNVGASLGRL